MCLKGSSEANSVLLGLFHCEAPDYPGVARELSPLTM